MLPDSSWAYAMEKSNFPRMYLLDLVDEYYDFKSTWYISQNIPN